MFKDTFEKVCPDKCVKKFICDKMAYVKSDVEELLDELEKYIRLSVEYHPDAGE